MHALKIYRHLHIVAIELGECLEFQVESNEAGFYVGLCMRMKVVGHVW